MNWEYNPNELVGTSLLLPQKGLSQDLKFLHGLLSIKNRRIPIKIKFRGPPSPPKKTILTVKSKKVVHFCGWDPGFDSRGTGGDVGRLFCRNMHWKNSASDDGGPSGGSHVRGHRSEDPHWR